MALPDQTSTDQTADQQPSHTVAVRRRRRAPLRAVLLTGAGLFVLSGVSFWNGENGTEAATPTGRSEARMLSEVLPPARVDPLPVAELAPAPAPVESERIVVAAAGDMGADAEPALGAWRSTSMTEPLAVTASGPRVAYAVAALGDPTAGEPATEALPVIPAVPRRPVAKAHAEDFSRVLLGKWVPNRDVCTDPEASEFLPLEISHTKAVAGGGECTFTSKRKVGGGWSVVAQCSDGAAEWTSNVNIDVTKNRLTWASERGTQSYERCDAPAPRIASRSTGGKVAKAGKTMSKVATKRTASRPRA